MKLRIAVLLVLFVFGLGPMAAVIGLNLPMVLDSLESLVNRGQLQNMQVEFSDLNGFLTSRQEMVRVLAKLPEPGALVKGTGPSANFTEIVNRLLQTAQDVYEVIYLDAAGNSRLRLRRERIGDPMRSLPAPAEDDDHFYYQVAMAMQGDGVYVSPIKFNLGWPEEGNHTAMYMRMVSPIMSAPKESPEGVVLVSMDVSGLPRAYNNTLWVMNDGAYLNGSANARADASAFADFPGLEDIFVQGVVGLWRGPKDRRVIWVPLFPTEDLGPVWVGRQVDSSDLAAFQESVELRVLLIFTMLVASVMLLARWIAKRVSRYGTELTEGVGKVLADKQGVKFSWPKIRELRGLAANLTRLADAHAQNTRELIDRANELEESNRYKSEFLANMSHELRTPLNSILLLSKMLAQNHGDNLNPEQVNQLRVIHNAGSDLLALINDILDISKIEARKVTVHLDKLDPASFWRPLVDLFEPMAREKGVTLVTAVAPDLPPQLISDGDKLRQILKNFLSNAVKFTPRGEIRITVGHSKASDAAVLPLCISVADTGIGIPENKQEQVFEAFRQADGSTSRRFGGTGLGLAISREIAILLGARIGLDSGEGRGSRFSLYLPLELDVSTLDPEFVEVGHKGGGRSTDKPKALSSAVALPTTVKSDVCLDTAPQLSGRRILVVDADLRSLLQLTPQLESWGLRVTAATSAEEVFETLDEEPGFDLTLVNSHALDDGSGQLTERLGKRDDTGHVLVRGDQTRGQVPESMRLLPAGVQGHELKESLCKALESVEELSE
ncbi:MAG: response regulator [Chromatiales bacterium]|nr:response regulator [Chromatiales bacterium]